MVPLGAPELRKGEVRRLLAHRICVGLERGPVPAPMFLDAMDRGNLMKRDTEQEEHIPDEYGSILPVVDPRTGDIVKQCEDDFFPTFDGMSAAGGRIDIACQGGASVCLKADVLAVWLARQVSRERRAGNHLRPSPTRDS